MHTDDTTDSRFTFEAVQEKMEGRLAAHRDLLTQLMALFARNPDAVSVLRSWLQEHSTVSDHQEDPGAVIVPGIAEQQARADEIATVAKHLDNLIAMEDTRR